MLVILGGRLLQGDYLQVLFIVGITGIVMAWGIYGSLFQVGQLLKASSPEPLVAYYGKRLGKLRIADLDANLAFSKGLVYTLYGRFESARTVINKVNWEQKPPLVQAPKIFLEALWAFLERHEFQQGLLLAQKARAMTDVSSAFPGAGIALSAYDAAVEIGQALATTAQPSVIASLEVKAKKLPILVRVLAVWGLEGHYRQSGQTVEASKMRAQLTKYAPHCRGLSPI
jgi:hypothetical protein